MSHNYYEDYRVQFKEDRNGGKPPQLSEYVQQGLAYCTATLFTTLKMTNQVYAQRTWMGRQTDATAVILGAARSNILKHKFSDALSLSNHIESRLDIPSLYELRSSFADVYFGNEFADEVIAGCMTQDDTGNPDDALRKVFPNMEAKPAMWDTLQELNSRVGRVITLRNSSTLNPVVDARNPLYIPVHAMNVADVGSHHKYTGIGRVERGRMDNGTTFTSDTDFSLKLTQGQEQMYGMLRRLRRGGTCYVAFFDFYLTYVTDFCRILESLLPERYVDAMLERAEVFVECRTAEQTRE